MLESTLTNSDRPIQRRLCPGAILTKFPHKPVKERHFSKQREETHRKKDVCFSHSSEAIIYNQLHIILRLFNVLTNFPFTTSETMGDNYLRTCYIRVASRVAERRLKTWDPRKLGNIRKVSKPDRMMAQCPTPPPK